MKLKKPPAIKISNFTSYNMRTENQGTLCYRVYANGKLMSTYRTKLDADNGASQLKWYDRNQTKDPYLNVRIKPAKIEVKEEYYNE